jgi:protein required for attachment to host cells
MTVWILVTDASRGRLFSTTGRSRPLRLVRTFEHAASRALTQDLVTDEPGRLFQSGSPGARSAAEPETSAHEAEAQKFARLLAHALYTELQHGAYGKLALVAPPKFLGLLRESLDHEVVKRLCGCEAKDLTSLSERDLPAHLVDVFAPGTFIEV